MNKVTIQDIARVAGVSKSTVSRVLNGTAKVHPDKHRAVVNATDRLGFKPSAVARSLASGRSMTIGVLTQSMGSPFYDTIAQGVIAGLNETGYSPIFVDGQWQRDKQLHALRALLGRQVDGVVLIGGDVPGLEITTLTADVPTVFVARHVTDSSATCISVDNVAGGFLATNHFIQLGHSRIAMIQGLEHHADAVDRLTGYEQALQAAGLQVDHRLKVDGDFSAESGVAAIDALIERDVEFTAIFCANDTTAFGARLALFQHGLRVPDDVSLIGYDDQMEVAFMTPPLTTIRQPARDMGDLAAKAVLSLLSAEPVKSVVVTPQLIERASVKRR